MFNRKSTTVVIERPTTEEVKDLVLWSAAPETSTIIVPEPIAPDNTSPMERSKALIMRLIPFAWVWGILAGVAWWQFPLLGAQGFLAFGVLTAITFLVILWLEYSHSPSGYQGRVLRILERLKRAEMKQEHQVRREALKAMTKGGVVSGRDW